MNSEPEFATVESPFIDQLVGMDWKLVNFDQPSVTGGEISRAHLIKSDVRKAIEHISLRDAKPWLDDASVAEAITAPEVAEVQKPGVMHRGLVEGFLSRRVRTAAFPTGSAT